MILAKLNKRAVEFDFVDRKLQALLNRKKVEFEASLNLAPPEGTQFDADAQAIFDRMPNPLLEDEKTKINNWVLLSKQSGNFEIHDHFFMWFLSDRSNALTDIFTGLQATAVNTPTHMANVGFNFNGTNQYIKTGIFLNTDSNNFTVNQSEVGVYLYEYISHSSIEFLFSAQERPNNYWSDILKANSILISRLNSDVNDRLEITESFKSKKRYSSFSLDGDNNLRLSENGTIIKSEIVTFTNLPTTELLIGARIDGGTAEFFYKGKQSYFYNGGGYNQTALQNELSQLENDLII